MTGLPTVGGDAGTWGTILNAYLTEHEVGYGTSLPGSPVDGQRYTLVDSTTNPAYQWTFRYNNGSSSAYKWEFVGGSARTNSVITGEQTTSTTAVDLTTVQSFTLPRAGDYDVRCASQAANTTGGQSCYMGITFGGADLGVNVGLTNATASFAGVLYREGRLLARSASDVIRVSYWVTGGTGDFSNRSWTVIPVRVS